MSENPIIMAAIVIVITLLFQVPAAAMTYKIRTGDSFIHIMKRHGFTDKNVSQLVKSGTLKRTFALVPGEIYSFNAKRRQLKFYHPDENKTLYITKRQNRIDIKNGRSSLFRRLRQVQGKITGSLIWSIKKLLPNTGVAYRFRDAYLLDLKPRRIRAGSNFSFTVEELYDEGHFIKYGDIVSAKIDHRGSTLKKKLFRFGQGKVHFSADDLANPKPFYSPVDKLKFTSLYQPRRRHPITGRLQPHLGIDFEQPKGSPVYSSAAGQIEKIGYGRAAGNYVVIRHHNGMRSYYNHLHTIHGMAKKGSWVFAGQRIGTIGCTGYCTSPHLHFAVKKKGRMIDPIHMIRSYPRHVESRLIDHIRRLEKKSFQ